MLSEKIDSTKNFVHRHRTALTVVATATPLIVLMKRNATIMNDFLKEHDLYDEYYAMDEI